jgi:isocitrate lyase
MFELSRKYKDYSMSAYVELQDEEFMAEHFGYTATRHQREVGTGYFDSVKEVIMGDDASSTLALRGSTESDQF